MALHLADQRPDRGAVHRQLDDSALGRDLLEQAAELDTVHREPGRLTAVAVDDGGDAAGVPERLRAGLAARGTGFGGELSDLGHAGASLRSDQANRNDYATFNDKAMGRRVVAATLRPRHGTDASVRHSNSELPDLSRWVLAIAFASTEPTDRTVRRGNFLPSSRAMVFATATSSIGASCSRWIAGPESSACVAQTSTWRPPKRLSPFAASETVPAVSIRSSVTRQSFPSIQRL